MIQENKKHLYWGRTIVSFLFVLFMMPLGHAGMILMEHFLSPEAVHYGGFLMGLAGFIITIIGVFVRGDDRQTLFGLIGALLFWTGWVEFLFQYYANRYGCQPEVVNGVVVTKPEYLILPATFGLWVMMMTLYVFCTRTGCNFFNWLQRHLFGSRRDIIAARPMTRHTSIVTFMEFNMIMWTCYLVLMFCYDPRFLGDHHPVTYLVGIVCFVGSILMFIKELHIRQWGANIHMAIATVIIFWTPVEILVRINFFKEFWVEPEQYASLMWTILAAFAVLGVWLAVKSRGKRRVNKE